MSLYDRISDISTDGSAFDLSAPDASLAARCLTRAKTPTAVTVRPRVGHASGASPWQRIVAWTRIGLGPDRALTDRASRGNGTFRRRSAGAFQEASCSAPAVTDRIEHRLLVCSGSSRRRPRSNRRSSTPPGKRGRAAATMAEARGRGRGRGATRARRVHGPRDYASCRLIKILRRSVHFATPRVARPTSDSHL
jgi:hypothetical protein